MVTDKDFVESRIRLAWSDGGTECLGDEISTDSGKVV